MRLPKKGFLGYIKEYKPKGKDSLEKWWNKYLDYLAVRRKKCTKA